MAENYNMQMYDNNNLPKRRKPRKKSYGKFVALLLCCSLMSGAAGAGGVVLYGMATSTKTVETEDDSTDILKAQRDSSSVNVSYVKTGTEMTASEIYEANVNSTVGITTSVTTNYFGYTTTAAASGSGFIISSNGYIITNYHVVEDANKITVTTYDNTQYVAELIGCDESNDIAVLKVDASNLTPVVIGDSDDMKVGDDVIAIGNPLGELTFSLTQGVVSALNRKVTINRTAMNLIQTDCAINSGNSGGALFNKYGEVVGITNAKYSNNSSTGASIDNVGFAIPMNNIIEIVKGIIENGYVVKPYIGISAYELSGRYQIKGIVVSSVEDGSPAEEAGIEQYDVITKVDGTEISSISEFKSILAGADDGDILTLEVYRDDALTEVKVKVVMRQQSALPSKDTQSANDQQYQQGQQIQQNPFGGYGGFPG